MINGLDDITVGNDWSASVPQYKREGNALRVSTREELARDVQQDDVPLPIASLAPWVLDRALH